MENNQEHRIDKIFRETFENQEITPPADAWMGVHTYTIRQEETKPKLWLRYASLALLVMLFSGFGLFYFTKNQASSPVAGLPTSPLVRSIPVVVARVLPHPIVHKYTPTLLPQVVDWSGDQPRGKTLLSQELLVENPNKGGTNISSHSIMKGQMSKLLMPKVDWSGEQPQEIKLPHEVVSENTDHGGENPNLDNITKSKLLSHEVVSEDTDHGGENIEIYEIESKPLILNDLSAKMQKESEKKIVVLEENSGSKKEAFKTDSVAYGNRFSLKHPIINFRLGMFNSSVSINANQGGSNPFNSDVINPNSIYAFSGIIGIAWKLSNKSRISLNSKFVSYSAVNTQSKSGAAYVDPLSPTNKPTGTFRNNVSKDVYEYLTPFGYITQQIDPKSSATPKDFDVWLSGSIKNWQIGLNYEYDLIAFRNKKGGIPAMEIYGLVGLNIQKVRMYNYSYSLFKNYDPNYNVIFYAATNQPIHTQSSLENGSPIVLGYNTGLGIRFQLSKGFGLNISGNYESNINSWVKDLPFTTRLSVLSAEGGFFVNL